MKKINRHTVDFIKELKSVGRYSFSEDDLFNAIPKTKKNIRKDLDRLRKKGVIQNVRRGFYTIIPDEYANMGILPAELYADDLMKYLEKKYYVGLFSAAMFHGAAHQQPQEFYIVTNSPKPRNIKKDGFIINFSEKKRFPVYGIEKKKTSTGYFNVSSRELTFLDLIYYLQNLGGMNRIITVLEELAEEIKINNLRQVLKNDFPTPVFQRAGYILDEIFHKEKLAKVIEDKLAKEKLARALLNPSGNKKGEVCHQWKVQINIQIESDI